MAPTPSGILRSQFNEVLSPFLVLNVFCDEAFPINCEVISFMLMASYKNNCALPLRSFSARLEIFAEKEILSFSRKKRGGLGITISSFCVTHSLVICLYLRSLVYAKPIIFHFVSASGMVNLITTLPFSSVWSVG